MQEPLLRSAGADLSAPSLAATEFDPACDSAQDAARQFHAQDAASGDFPLTPSEEPLDHAPAESWSERIEKDNLVKGVAFNWFQELHNRMANVEKKVEENQDRNNEAKKLANDLARDASVLKILPEVRDCNWKEFKNRYSLLEGVPAIDVLLSGHDLDREIDEEQLKRLDTEKRRDFMVANNKTPAKRTHTGNQSDIERVRINSPAVLSFLAEVTEQTTWKGDKPHTFLRPFKVFIHFHEKMERKLDNLSMHELEGREFHDTELEESPQIKNTESSPASQAYLEIKCYVEFVRDRLLPDYRKFEGADYGTRTKVRFAELWSLFRVGDLVLECEDNNVNKTTPSKGRGHGAASQSSGRRIWRVFHVINDSVSWAVDDLNAAGGNLRSNRDEDTPADFYVYAYRIDYNGSEYAPVVRTFYMSPFDGEKSITKLVVYPSRFQRGSDKVIEGLRERGKRFQQLLEYQHRAIEHDGWTLLHDPSGDRITNASSHGSSEYVSSDVIIDFDEAYQRHPAWKPETTQYFVSPWSPALKEDLFPVIQWSNSSQSHQVSSITEVVVEDDDVDELEWFNFIKTDNFIADPEAKSEARGLTKTTDVEDTKQELTDEDLALLPARMFVYSLRDRKFINADIRYLQMPQDVPDPFGELKIPEQDKSLIKKIVLDHFEKKQVHRQLQGRLEGTSSYEYEQDFIPRKGQGLVILLHGAPGVGKTATAEAVAYTHKKPLFPITCGDLGTSPDVVERTLQDIFRLANLWDCVLLLDEAEIFLTRREQRDDNLQRNALVSTFLRTLEYYPGILFLTTNRVGVLDEAFNSRVHVSMHFKHLSMQQTLALFEMNVRRCRLIADQRASVTNEPALIIKAEEIFEFAEQNFEDNIRKHPSKMPWWNGRQIRNAFQIATSLAYERDATDDNGRPQKYLGKAEFEQVMRVIDDYTKYKLGVHRKTEEELAYGREERTMPPRNDPRRYAGQQEMVSRPSHIASPYSLGPHHSAMLAQDRPLQGAYASPHVDSSGHGPGTPSRHYPQSSFDSGYPPSQSGSLNPSRQSYQSREGSADL